MEPDDAAVGETPPGLPPYDAPWQKIFEHGPVPTLLLAGTKSGVLDPGTIVWSNRASRVFNDEQDRPSTSIFDMLAKPDHATVLHLLAQPPSPLRTSSETVIVQMNLGSGPGVSPSHPTARPVTLHLHRGPQNMFIAQVAECDAWQAVAQMLEEQQQFRSALMELSELSHTTKDDADFYQRLLERAVEVVPGAQGGSVQLKVEGTTAFRFVAAVGYDLPGLQTQVLEQRQFFRDAWDPKAQIVREFDQVQRSPEITHWLQTVGRLSEIVVNVSGPVLVDHFPVAFLSLDNFEDPDAITETSVEMTTVLSRLIGDLWVRRSLEGVVRSEREALRHQAFHDTLTGLANRRSLEKSLLEMLENNRRNQSPSVVLFVDIDDFKGVNDRHGHLVGDQLLAGVATGLREVTGQNDVVGRWGGDEFLILPAGLLDRAAAHLLAETVLAYFEHSLVINEELEVRAELSVGVGWTDQSQLDTSALVRLADGALYEAKAAGKGVARVWQA